MKATYILVDRRTGQEIFRHTVESRATASAIGVNENDLHNATRISSRVFRALAIAGASAAVTEGIRDLDPTVGVDDFGELGNAYGYSEWTQDEWNSFLKIYRNSLIDSLVIGPTVVGLDLIDPFNYVPFADDGAAEKAAATRDQINDFQPSDADRNASQRAANAIHRALARNVAGFLLALTEQEGVTPTPILPCHGDAEVEALKRAFMSRGVSFRTDDCAFDR